MEEIGYLVPEPAPFRIDPRGVDREIAEIAAPQLVVPVLNARFLLNAANARGGASTTRFTNRARLASAADMLDQTIAHPQAGASTARVPRPAAAVPHATYYHRIDVADRQADRASELVSHLDELLTPALAPSGLVG